MPSIDLVLQSCLFSLLGMCMYVYVPLCTFFLPCENEILYKIIYISLLELYMNTMIASSFSN